MIFLPNFFGFSKKINNPIYLQQILPPEPTLNGNYFGYGISISLDGNVLAVTGHNTDTGKGAVYVYTKNNGMWEQEAKIAPNDLLANDHAGYAVAVSGDGNRIVFSAPDHDTAGVASTGAIYVYVKNNSTWSQEYKYSPSTNVVLGWSVSINYDGTKIIAGGPYDDANGYVNNGTARFFERSNGSWSLINTLTASDSADNDFAGTVVCISGDGNTAALAAVYDDIAVNSTTYYDVGSVIIFVRDSTTGSWTEQAKLMASDFEAYDMFGEHAVSLNYDGTILAVGARRNDLQGYDSGSAYIFTRSNTTWTQSVRLEQSGGIAVDNFGISVCINNSGDLLAVGSFGDDELGNNAGSVFIFKKINTTWTEIYKILPYSAAAGDLFGYNVSFGSSSNDLAVTSIGHSSNKGAVYLYKIPT